MIPADAALIESVRILCQRLGGGPIVVAEAIDDVIVAARAAERVALGHLYTQHQLDTAVATAVAIEREECADVCSGMEGDGCADAVRARGNL